MIVAPGIFPYSCKFPWFFPMTHLCSLQLDLQMTSLDVVPCFPARSPPCWFLTPSPRWVREMPTMHRPKRRCTVCPACGLSIGISACAYYSSLCQEAVGIYKQQIHDFQLNRCPIYEKQNIKAKSKISIFFHWPLVMIQVRSFFSWLLFSHTLPKWQSRIVQIQSQPIFPHSFTATRADFSK